MSTYKSTRLGQNIQTKRMRQISPSKNFIYSPLAVEQDQKKIIITKLKDQIKLLQSNEHEFNQQKQHYKRLDLQYNNLLSQKRQNDKNFAKQHQAALKNISQLKNQIDEMKVQFRQKKSEIQDLEADQNTLKNQLDLKLVEIQKLKNQFKSSLADSQQLTSQHQKLSQINQSVLGQRQTRSQQFQSLKQSLNKIQTKQKQFTNYKVSLQKEEKLLTQQIIKFQQENNKTDENISVTCQDLAIIDNKINVSEHNIMELQTRIAQTVNFSDKYKNEGIMYKKSIQSQVMKNNDLVKSIQQAENISNVRVNQVKEGHKQLQMLTEENIQLQKVNIQLEDDLQACRKHLQNLALLNGELVKHMEKISQQDEQVRVLIDRRSRVQQASSMVKQSELSRKGINKQLQDTREQSFRSGGSPYQTSRSRRKYY